MEGQEIRCIIARTNQQLRGGFNAANEAPITLLIGSIDSLHTNVVHLIS